MLDPQGGVVLLGDVACCTTDPEYGAALIANDAGVDADPTVESVRRDKMTHVVADLAVPLERGEEPPIGDVRRACLEIEEAAA